MSDTSQFIKENKENLLGLLEDPETELYNETAKSMRTVVQPGTVDLVVTSPPYPMVKMWDRTFRDQNAKSWHMQHKRIKDILDECYEALCPGGIMCVNIGDATRSTTEFQLFPNAAKIWMEAMDLGFYCLPYIIWKKPTNKPNKFMGSGMQPPNAYVTQECEYILIFRKSVKRAPLHEIRCASAYSFDERNRWFSQFWDVKGKKQEGYAQFPDVIPYRLVRMFSCLGDTVLDPFMGTGTTLKVARALGRSAIGFDIDDEAYARAESELQEVESISMEDALVNKAKHSEWEVHSNDNDTDVKAVKNFIRNSGTLLDY